MKQHTGSPPAPKHMMIEALVHDLFTNLKPGRTFPTFPNLAMEYESLKYYGRDTHARRHAAACRGDPRVLCKQSADGDAADPSTKDASLSSPVMPPLHAVLHASMVSELTAQQYAVGSLNP